MKEGYWEIIGNFLVLQAPAGGVLQGQKFHGSCLEVLLGLVSWKAFLEYLKFPGLLESLVFLQLWGFSKTVTLLLFPRKTVTLCISKLYFVGVVELLLGCRWKGLELLKMAGNLEIYKWLVILISLIIPIILRTLGNPRIH